MEFMLDVVQDNHDPLCDDHVMDPDNDMEELIMIDNGTANLDVEEMMNHEEPPSHISVDQVHEFILNAYEISFGGYKTLNHKLKLYKL